MTTDDATDPARRRGRPRVLDRSAIAVTTFRLWAERGYDAVGWREIANEAGVSVRTLIRHFSRKSEIAWTGVPAATERLRESLRATPDDVPVHDAIRTGVLASLALGPSGADWVRVVCAQEELAGSATAAYRPWIEELADYLGEQLPGISRAAAMAVATGYQAATFSTLVSWSDGNAADDAAAAVDEALQWLAVRAPIQPPPESSECPA